VPRQRGGFALGSAVAVALALMPVGRST